MFTIKGLRVCSRLASPSQVQCDRLNNVLHRSAANLSQQTALAPKRREFPKRVETFKKVETPKKVEPPKKMEIPKDLPENVLNESLRNDNFFGTKSLVKMNEMFDARVYMGHKIGTVNEFMKPYIYGDRLGHLVIDLNQTKHLLNEALNFTANIAFRNGIILFINKSATTGHIVEEAARACGEYAHCREWRVGTFTDSTNFFEAVTRLPDLLIFLNTMNNVFEVHPAVPEAAKMMIPTIGVVDTNSNPSLITYPVPGNDDSIQSIQYMSKLFQEAVRLGKEKRQKYLKEVPQNSK